MPSGCDNLSLDLRPPAYSETPPDNHLHHNKPFNMSYRRLLTIVFIVLNIVSVISLFITVNNNLDKIKDKQNRIAAEILEGKLHYHTADRGSLAICSLLAYIGVTSHLVVRLIGLVGAGACGREFADTEFESSDRRENCNLCMTYVCGMVIIFCMSVVGIFKMSIIDQLLHIVLTAFGGIFVAFALQSRGDYSKDLQHL